MAWVHDFAITEGTVAAAATGAANMPEHQADDMLVCFAGKDGTGALTENSSSGWTALSSGAGAAQWIGAWYKRASGSSETAPSFTLSSDEYNIIVVAVRGAHTSTAPTSAISTNDATMTDGGYLFDGTLDSAANSIVLFGACSDTGIGIEPMPGSGQILYAGDVGTAGVGVWWQFFKNASVSTSAYRFFGAVADDSRGVKVLVPDDGNNTYEPGRIDLTSTFHKIYGGPFGGTTLVAPDTTWTLPLLNNSISMLGDDWDKAWNYDGTSSYTDVTSAINRDWIYVTARNITAGSSSTDANNYTTATVVLRPGFLYLLSVENSKASAADVVSSITNGPTWTSRSSTTFNTSTANRVSIWSGVPSTTYVGTLTINFGGVTQTGAVWSLNEFANVDTATNDGIVQQAVNTGNSAAPSATLAAFSSFENATFGAFGVGSTSAGTAGTGFTELSDTTAATPAQALQTGFRINNSTTVNESITSAQWGACAVEIKCASQTTAFTNSTNAAIYFGSTSLFNSAGIAVVVAGAGGSPVAVWEYYNGSTWATLTVTDWPNATSWTSLMTVVGYGHIKFTPPSTWAPTSVNGEGSSYYYIRRRITTTYGTNAPTLSQCLKEGRALLYDASTGIADSGVNPYHLAYSSTPAAGTSTTYLQHSGAEYIASPYNNDSNRRFGIPDFSSGYLLTTFLLTVPRDIIDLGFYDLHKGAAITLMSLRVAPRHQIAGSSSTDANSYTTASVTMKAGLLYLMSVENSHGSSATAVSAITATGGGAPTFTSRSSVQFNSSLNRVSVWSCVPGSDYTGTLDIAFGGTTQTGACWSLTEFLNVDTTTNDGVVQQVTNTGSSTVPYAVLAAYGSNFNVSFGAFGVGAANAGTPIAGYTELSDTTAATPAQALQTIFQNVLADRVVGETISTAQWGACGLELKSLNTADRNRKTWICGAKDAADQKSSGFKVIGIQPTQTVDTAWGTHGSLGGGSIDTFIGSLSAPFGTTSATWSLLLKAGNHILSGGTAALPLTFQQAAAALVNGANLFPVWNINGDVADIWHPTQFGGGDDIHIDFDLKTFQFPTRASAASKTTQWHVDDDQIGFDFNGQSGDTLRFTNCLFTGGTPYYWRLNASANSGATWDFSGSTVVGATVTLQSVYTFTTITFNNCSEITLNGADITDATIRDTRATTSQGAIALTSATEGNGVDRITFIDNNDGDIGHSIRITATGTYTFDGHTFSGGGPAAFSFHTQTDVDAVNDEIDYVGHGYSTGDAIYYQDQGGTDTIGLTDGTLYYVRAITADALAFYPTKADALADTNQIDLSDGSGGETHYIYSAKADVFVDASGSTTINITNGGDIPTIRERDGATVTVQNVVTVRLTAKDATSLAAIENARVLMEADAGGDLPAGDSVTISRSGSTASVVHTAHGMTSGTQVVIRGVAEDEYNGVFTISNVSTNGYDYTVSGTPATPATGTPTATAVILAGLTNVSGILETTAFNYTADQPVAGKVRRASTGTKYKTGTITGTITTSGLDTIILLIIDE